MLQFGRKRFPPGARRVAVDYLRRRQALPDSLTALCDRRLRNQMQAIALIRLLDIRPKPRFKTHKSVRHELRRAAAPTSVLQAIKDIIQQENASALFISRCVLHSWRWRESNPRPNREPESFLHAYPPFRPSPRAWQAATEPGAQYLEFRAPAGTLRHAISKLMIPRMKNR